MTFVGNVRRGVLRAWFFCTVSFVFASPAIFAQANRPSAAQKSVAALRPKLVVMLVVDQMRGDYVDKFQGQWTGGLKRLVEQGAWFRAAAYPYAATETCPGHTTISTGAFPLSHGIVANTWWDRDTQQMVTCTADPKVTNSAYAGASTKGGDSAWRMKLPAFAEELKFQSGSGTRVVTLSLKARAAITLAGTKADAATWADPNGSWVTSSAYGTQPAIENFVKQHPVTGDYGKTWSLSLPQSSYLYPESASGSATPDGWTTTFPHALRGKEGASAPDAAFFDQWASSPFADTYLTKMAEAAVEAWSLGKGKGTDYLGISYSTPDYVGHRFGPRSWEIQDTLVHLDKDLGELFAYLDLKVGRGNYVVALTADHGVAPIPADMQTTGFDAGTLNLGELKERIEKALEPFDLTKPAVARIAENDLYFAPGVYEKLQQDPAAMKAAIDAAKGIPGVAAVWRSEELSAGLKNDSWTRTAAELSYFAGRSGDLFILQQPYWLTRGTAATGAQGYTGTGHGTPYYYDQHVPILLMGFGIKPGQYLDPATPADIAPTFAALTGITLATRDGRVLQEALAVTTAKPGPR
jgi:predicted AlkP superfamily pyrophosphatase or phosphodiesterase